MKLYYNPFEEELDFIVSELDELLTSSYTAGSILFADGTTIAEDNPNLFWDNTLNRMGIGTISPQKELEINGGLVIENTGRNANGGIWSWKGDGSGVGLLFWYDVNNDFQINNPFGLSVQCGKAFKVDDISARSTDLTLDSGINNLILQTASADRIKMYSSGTILVSGDTGFGIAPLSRLHLPGDEYIGFGSIPDVEIGLNSGDNSLDIDLTGGANTDLKIISDGDPDTSSPVFFIDGQNARVGIGTTSPGNALSISTATDQLGWVHGDGTIDLSSYVGAGGGWLGTSTNHPLYFYTNNSSALMTLNTSGDLGIGIAPLSRLHLPDDEYIGLGNAPDAKIGYTSNYLDIDLTGGANTGLIISTGGDSNTLNIDGSNGHIGISQSAISTHLLGITAAEKRALSFTNTVDTNATGAAWRPVQFKGTYGGSFAPSTVQMFRVRLTGKDAFTSTLAAFDATINHKSSSGFNIIQAGYATQLQADASGGAITISSVIGADYGMGLSTNANALYTITAFTGSNYALPNTQATTNAVSLTVDDWKGVTFEATEDLDNTLTVTNAYGIYIPEMSGAVNDITNQYGIYIEDLSNAQTTNIPIFLAGSGGIFFNDVNSYINHDGTNLILTDDGDIDVSCGTDRTLELQETVWNDLRVPVLATKVGSATYQPTWSQLQNDGAGSRGVYTYYFSPSTENEVFFVAQMSHEYKEGTDLKPHVHWTPDNTNTGTCRWVLEYTIANVNGNFGNTSTVVLEDAGSGTADDHLVTSAGTISGTGLNISHMLVCRVYRDASHANDTFTGNAGLLEVDFHFEINTMGSRQAFIK